MGATGVYTIVVDPPTTSTGSLTLTLYDVPPDVTGTIVAGGAATTVTIPHIGQNGALTFSGTAGQRVFLQMVNNQLGDTLVTLLGPTGSFLASGYACGCYGFGEAVTLQHTGVHTLHLNPPGMTTGSLTLRLYDVPPDVTGPIEVGGAATTVTIPNVGQGAALTFSGTAGQRVFLQMTNNLLGDTLVKVLGPTGTTLASGYSCGCYGLGDPVTLQQTGTHTVHLNPPGVTTGSLTLRLYDVPPDVTGSLTIGDAPTPLTLAVGQAAALTVSGTASQPVTVRITSNTAGYVRVRLFRPDGSQQTWNASGSSSFTLATQTLATTGTYTVTVNPTGVGAGGIAVQVTSP